MTSFVRISPGWVHGDFKRRDDYTASRRAGTMHYCIAVSFDVLPAHRVSFDVLPTQRVYPWDSISDGFVLPRDNQSLTDTRWVLMCDQHRFIVLERSSLMDTMDDMRDGTRRLRRSDDELVTPPPPPNVKRCNNNVRRWRIQQEGGGGWYWIGMTTAAAASDWTSTTSLTRTTTEFNEWFTMAWAELTISFFRCIADEAIGLINYNNILYREAIILQQEH